MVFIPQADTDPWQTLLPLLVRSWHVYTPTATHMDPQTHTYAVKVWKWLCMIREQPKAPQGINNRPNPETTNTISRLQKDVGVMFVNVCACGGYWMIWRCDLHLIFIYTCFCLHVCFLFPYVCAGHCDCVFFLHVCVCECEQWAPYLFHPTGHLWPLRTCWLLHSNPLKTFTP